MHCDTGADTELLHMLAVGHNAETAAAAFIEGN